MIRETLIEDSIEHKYPTVSLTKVLFLDGEFQIVQGSGSAEFDPSANHDVVSVSGTQAVALAHAILKFAGEAV